MLKSFHLALLLLTLPVLSIAQINNVSYRLSFNPVTNQYDCYLHVIEGQTKKTLDRVQLNAQLTLLVPTGSEVEVAHNYMPLQDNQDYKGTKPMVWNKANVINKPASDPFHDYVSIVPQLSPTSFYHDLKSGDQVKLFSLRISHVANCGDDVVLFNNFESPSSLEVGMKGADFRNGFTMGGIGQKYSRNEVSVTPALDIVKNIKTSNVTSILLEAISDENPLYGPYTYEWHTPMGTSKEGKKLSVAKPSFSDYGVYQLMVTDARGCKQLKTVEIKSKEDAQIYIAHENLSGNGASSSSNVAVNSRSFVENKVSIYPNPASSEFFINLETEIGTKIDLVLADASGRNIIKNILSTVSNQNNLNVMVPTEDLVPGSYMVLAKINGKESAHKVIIVK